MHMHYVFFAKGGKQVCQSCYTDWSAFLYVKSLFENIVY